MVRDQFPGTQARAVDDHGSKASVRERGQASPLDRSPSGIEATQEVSEVGGHVDQRHREPVTGREPGWQFGRLARPEAGQSGGPVRWGLSRAGRLDTAGEPDARRRVLRQLTEDLQGTLPPLVDLVLRLDQVRPPHRPRRQRRDAGHLLGDHVHRSTGFGKNDGGGEPRHPGPDNDNALPCGHDPDPNGRVASTGRVRQGRAPGLAGSCARGRCAVGGAGLRRAGGAGRAARRAHDVEAVGDDLADLAGGLQVTMGAVAQGQPGPFEHGPALAGVAARDVVRPGPEHLRPLGEEAPSPRAAIRLQLGAAHLDEAVTGLAVQVVIGEEVHPAGFSWPPSRLAISSRAAPRVWTKSLSRPAAAYAYASRDKTDARTTGGTASLARRAASPRAMASAGWPRLAAWKERSPRMWAQRAGR